MIRLYILAEGQTEERFVKEIIGPHLANYDCFASAFCMNTSLSKKGGLISYEQAKKHITRMLASDNNSNVRISTMFDLYALPKDFPAYKEAVKKTNPESKIEMLEIALAKEIDNIKFIPYIQLHGFEALIFSDPNQLIIEYPDRAKEIATLVAVSENTDPEHINENPNTSPSHRIIELIPYFSKKAAGVTTLMRIGLPKLRERCPHFNEWLVKLENLNS